MVGLRIKEREAENSRLKNVRNGRKGNEQGDRRQSCKVTCFRRYRISQPRLTERPLQPAKGGRLKVMRGRRSGHCNRPRFAHGAMHWRG